MGSYPSADLVYGIDLGLYEETDWPWLTDKLEEECGGPSDVMEHLLKDVDGVGYVSYGNSNADYIGMALSTQCIGARAYEAKHIDEATLTRTAGDDAKLRVAWDKLYPGEGMPHPGWFLVVSYG